MEIKKSNDFWSWIAIKVIVVGIVYFIVGCLVVKFFNRNKDRVGFVIIKYSCFLKLM